ncbi:transposable element Tcb2 transposase [Trichonephila clavipes]|nr:transposable element Tcb2 transposase [Trichonephila clavipes]
MALGGSLPQINLGVQDEAPKPRLPDSIDHPIAVMPSNRMQNTTLAMPLIEDLSRHGIEDCSYSPEAQKKQRLLFECAELFTKKGELRLLAKWHLESGRPLRVLPLTPTHRRLRLEWYRVRVNWTAEEWSQVVFRDKSRFNLSNDDNRVRVWRPLGERLNPAFALQRHIAPTAGVMVWGAIAYKAWSLLILIRFTMTAQRYVHDIILQHVLPLMQRLSGDIFQQDNARPHRAQQGCYQTVSALLLLFLGFPDPKFCV